MNDYQFYILPANPAPRFLYRSIYNQAYQHYKKVWQRILNRPNKENIYNADEFLRQSYIFLVLDQKNKKVVAQILGTHINLLHSITSDLSYFQNFNYKGLDLLEKMDAKSLLSLEYSSVSKNYSPRNLDNLNFGEVITYLGMKFAKSIYIDAILGQPRRLTKTNTKVLDSGFRIVKSKYEKVNLSVDIMIGFVNEFKAHKEDRVNLLVEKLWLNRIDTIGITTDNLAQYGLSYKRSPSIISKNNEDKQTMKANL